MNMEKTGWNEAYQLGLLVKKDMTDLVAKATNDRLLL